MIGRALLAILLLHFVGVVMIAWIVLAGEGMMIDRWRRAAMAPAAQEVEADPAPPWTEAGR